MACSPGSRRSSRNACRLPAAVCAGAAVAQAGGYADGVTGSTIHNFLSYLALRAERVWQPIVLASGNWTFPVQTPTVSKGPDDPPEPSPCPARVIRRAPKVART